MKAAPAGAALTLMVLLLTPASTRAASIPSGTIELQPDVAFSHSSTSLDGVHQQTLTTLSVAGAIGYSITDLVAVDVTPMMVHVSARAGGTSVSGGSAGLTA